MKWFQKFRHVEKVPSQEERILFDLSKLTEAQLLEIRREAVWLVKSKLLGTVLADRARKISQHIALSAKDMVEVEKWRGRLEELDAVINQFKSLGKLPKEQKPLNPNNIF